MEKDIDKVIRVDEPLGRIFRSLLQGMRPASSGSVDTALAKKEAQKLYDIFIHNVKVGQGYVGTDQLEIVRILCSRSYSELRVISDEFNRIANTDIEIVVDNIQHNYIKDLYFKIACVAICMSFDQFFFLFFK